MRNVLLSLVLACMMCFGVVGMAWASENGERTGRTTAEPTKLTAIIESADSDQSTGVVKALNISKVSNYKLLCLIALGNDINDDAKTIGTNWCKYTNITIGGTTVSLDNMKFYQEHASFPSMSNGNVEIQVSK